MSLLTSPLSGKVRTDMYCHACGGNFVACIDMDVDGAHIVYCPCPTKDGKQCGHQHCRIVKGGIVTGDRWEGRSEHVDMTNVEIVQSQPVMTSTRSAFLRQRWLDNGQ